MPTSMKTVEFWAETADCTDATDTNQPQITVYLPESSIVFKSVILETVFHDRNTTLGNYTRRQLSLQLGAVGYSTVDNTNTITNGGEQQTLIATGDFTAYFTTNWTGTSMTCDVRFLGDLDTATPLDPSHVNLSTRLIITYEYDDTSTTQIKTVRIPLNCPVGAMGTSKPGTANDTIPALDTELPEASKVYRQQVIVAQGNDAGSTTDLVLNMQVDTDTAFASYAYEHGSSCNMFIRVNDTVTFTTNATHGFYIWGSAVNFNHFQAWLVVTYEFNASTSTTIYNSVMLPFDLLGVMGGETASDYQRASATLWIEEPTTITTKSMAAYFFWTQVGTIADLYCRLGTGSFVAYTNIGIVNAGSNACMVRNDAAFTLARGKNTLTADIYRTDTVDLGAQLCGYVLVNYTSGKAAGGVGSHNRTVIWPIITTGTAALAQQFVTAATAVTIPETAFFISSIGQSTTFIPIVATAIQTPPAILVERLAAEGGVKWEPMFLGFGTGDSEIGIYLLQSDASRFFKRWAGDPDTTRFDIETARRYKFVGSAVSTQTNLASVYVLMTYHSITFTVGGTLSAFSTGTVYVYLLDRTTKEVLLATSRSGDGAYSFTWFDNVSTTLIAAAYEDDTHTGLSADGSAS